MAMHTSLLPQLYSARSSWQNIFSKIFVSRNEQFNKVGVRDGDWWWREKKRINRNLNVTLLYLIWVTWQVQQNDARFSSISSCCTTAHASTASIWIFMKHEAYFYGRRDIFHNPSALLHTITLLTALANHSCVHFFLRLRSSCWLCEVPRTLKWTLHASYGKFCEDFKKFSIRTIWPAEI